MSAGLLFAAASAVCLGTLAILGKLGYAAGLSTLEIIQARFGLGALLLTAWTLATRPGLLAPRPRTLGKAALLGAVVYPVQSTCFMTALAHIPASTTSLIYYLYPLGTTALAAVFLGLRPGRIVYQAAALITAGCVLVFHDALSRDMDPLGMLAAAGAMAVYSAYLTLIQVLLPGENPRQISLWVVIFAGIAFTVASPPAHLLGRPDPAAWAVALGLGLVPTALAATLLYQAVERAGSAMTAIFSTLEPVTTVLLAAAVLGETVLAAQVAGMGLIVAGIAWPNLRLARL